MVQISEEKPYKCDFCEKGFPSSGALTKHRRVHTGERPYSCPMCGNRFAAKETLNRHGELNSNMQMKIEIMNLFLLFI